MTIPSNFNIISQVIANQTYDKEGVLCGILFVCLVCAGLHETLFAEILLKVMRKNEYSQHYVKPRLYGIISLCSVETVFILIFFLSMLYRSFTFLVMFSFLSIVNGIRVIRILSSRLDYRNGILIYTSFYRKQIIYPNEICAVTREIQSRSFGYTITFYLSLNRQINFSEGCYIGLEELWKTFNKADGTYWSAGQGTEVRPD